LFGAVATIRYTPPWVPRPPVVKYRLPPGPISWSVTFLGAL
jgi:hypothetical protein